jgi:site-specific DNA recombinase
MCTAIAGDAKRGVGILNNEIYIGRIVWNRVRWLRSASDSSKRRCVVNPANEWIVREDERLRVIDNALWGRVKARQRQQIERVGVRIKAGVRRDRAQRTGRSPK